MIKWFQLIQSRANTVKSSSVILSRLYIVKIFDRFKLNKGGDSVAVHEFGIMQSEPKQGERYDKYEALKYNCICVSDDYLEGIVGSFNHIDFYWHSIDAKGKGLAYCGITLIPPFSLNAFIEVIKDISELSNLKELAQEALSEKKWIIHFGL